MNSHARIAALGVALAFVTACDRSSSPPAPDQPPAVVAAAVNAALAEYRGTNSPDAPWPESAARAVHVSPDGIPDWLIDFEAFGFPASCGTGGCRRQLWVSHGGRHVLAYDAQALEFGLRDAAGPPIIDVELHGVYCNRTGADACPRAFAWNVSMGQLDEVPNRIGGTVLYGPLFQPVPLDPTTAPPSVVAAAGSVRQACAAAGGRYEEFDTPIVSVPDLDGDGRRDWIYDGSLVSCEAGAGVPGGVPVRVFLSDGGVHETAPLPGGEYDIDIGSRPARILPRASSDATESSEGPE